MNRTGEAPRAPIGEAATVAAVGLAYNQSRYIDAFAARLLPQKDLFDEVIFVDNCSQDDSEARFLGLGFGRVVRRPDRSTARFLNDIARIAQSEWLLILAVDDLLKPNAARLVRDTLRRAPRNSGQIHCSQNPIDEEGKPMPVPPPLKWRVWPAPVKGLLQFAGLIQPTQPGVVYRREAVLATVAREEEWIEDYGLTVRLGLRYPAVDADVCWAERRVVPRSFGSVAWPLENASAVTRQNIAAELARGTLTLRAMQSLAAYGRSRFLIGQGDWRGTMRLSLESLSLNPLLPLGLHTLVRAAQLAVRLRAK
jgi:glycosyltransferase involved in cell wall biosynthesis